MPVVKHGSRKASSDVGAADLLEALGVTIAPGPDVVARCVEEAGFGFCFAPAFHPALAAVGAGSRRTRDPDGLQLPRARWRTPRRSATCCSASRTPSCTIWPRSFGARGGHHALVVRGDDGLDEVSASGRPARRSRSAATARRTSSVASGGSTRTRRASHRAPRRHPRRRCRAQRRDRPRRARRGEPGARPRRRACSTPPPRSSPRNGGRLLDAGLALAAESLDSGRGVARARRASSRSASRRAAPAAGRTRQGRRGRVAARSGRRSGRQREAAAEAGAGHAGRRATPSLAASSSRAASTSGVETSKSSRRLAWPPSMHRAERREVAGAQQRARAVRRGRTRSRRGARDGGARVGELARGRRASHGRAGGRAIAAARCALGAPRGVGGRRPRSRGHLGVRRREADRRVQRERAGSGAREVEVEHMRPARAARMARGSRRPTSLPARALRLLAGRRRAPTGRPRAEREGDADGVGRHRGGEADAERGGRRRPGAARRCCPRSSASDGGGDAGRRPPGGPRAAARRPGRPSSGDLEAAPGSRRSRGRSGRCRLRSNEIGGHADGHGSDARRCSRCGRRAA